MLAKLALLLGKKKDGSWTVIKTADKPPALIKEIGSAITSGDYVAVGIARNLRITRTRRNVSVKLDARPKVAKKPKKAKSKPEAKTLTETSES